MRAVNPVRPVGQQPALLPGLRQAAQQPRPVAPQPVIPQPVSNQPQPVRRVTPSQPVKPVQAAIPPPDERQWAVTMSPQSAKPASDGDLIRPARSAVKLVRKINRVARQAEHAGLPEVYEQPEHPETETVTEQYREIEQYWEEQYREEAEQVESNARGTAGAIHTDIDRRRQEAEPVEAHVDETPEEEQFSTDPDERDKPYCSPEEIFPDDVMEEALKKKEEVKEELARRTTSDRKANTLHVLAEIIDGVKLTNDEKRALFHELRKEISGYGVLDAFMNDSRVTEVMVNDHLNVFIKVDGSIRRTNVQFPSAKALEDYVQNLIRPIGRPLDESNTNLNGQLPDGTRLNATCPPQSKEYTLNLRKPPGKTARFSVEEYVVRGAATKEIMDFLGHYHRRRANILILGPTDTGKTTVIRILIENYSDPRERWIMLEETFELNCLHPHFLAFQQVQRGKDESEWFTLSQIFDRTVLRKAPDRIGVGEILRGEATALIRSVAAGHRGFIGSMHAGSPETAIFMLIVKLREAGMEMGEEYLRQMLHECIDFMVFLERSENTGRRVISEVWEVLTMDEAREMNVKPFNLLFKFNKRTKVFEKVGDVISRRKKERYGDMDEVIDW